MRPARAVQTPIAPARGRLFGARAAAEYLGISESRVRQLLRRGALASIRTREGRLEGIYEQDCDAWVAEHRRAVIAIAAPVRPRQVAIDERMKQFMPRERVFG